MRESPMTTIGILSEGRTDQEVIRQVLLGFFGRSDFLEINAFFPPEVPLPGEPEEGGWTVLKRRLQDGHHRQALQFNDYIVIHIDTDRCEDKGYDVSRREPTTGLDLEPDVLRKAAIARLREWMGSDFYEKYGHKVLFAVAVNTIECWLLPLLEGKPAKQGKTAGCERAANEALKLAGRDSLGYGNKLRRYAEEAEPYSKRKTLMAAGPLNPSLRAFLDELTARSIEIRAE
jgi:hypothetical protein